MLSKLIPYLNLCLYLTPSFKEINLAALTLLGDSGFFVKRWSLCEQHEIYMTVKSDLYISLAHRYIILIVLTPLCKLQHLSSFFLMSSWNNCFNSNCVFRAPWWTDAEALLNTNMFICIFGGTANWLNLVRTSNLSFFKHVMGTVVVPQSQS